MSRDFLKGGPGVVVAVWGVFYKVEYGGVGRRQSKAVIFCQVKGSGMDDG